MVRNGKYFVPPSGGEYDFKTLFKRAASAGAGRPADNEGFPQGSWTPDALAEAISQIEANSAGIELRTVQLWFQDNEKGISADNIRWLARIFGCDDPEATSAWQAELSASQARLTAKRRAMRRHGRDEQVVPTHLDTDQPAAAESVEPSRSNTAENRTIETSVEGTGLAGVSEALFSHGSPLNLPATVFAGAVGLQFISYFLGIHSVTYTREGGTVKQIGFLWAPNWTFLFNVFLPLFLAFTVDLVVFWRTEGRTRLLAAGRSLAQPTGWMRKVQASSYTFWAVFLICVGFAGLFQWINVNLLPLLTGDGDYAIDWGSLALVRPEAISVSHSVAFTGLAYLYMCLCFYLLLVGLILLYTVADDFSEIGRASERHQDGASLRETREIGLRIVRGIFRCTVAGLFIAITMRLQSSYVVTSAPNIWTWLYRDARSVLFGFNDVVDWGDYSMPTHYTSLLVALIVGVVFIYGLVRVGLDTGNFGLLAKMVIAIVFLGVSYLMIGVFAGFSILLGFSSLLAIYGLFDPGFGTRQAAPIDDLDIS